MILPFMLLLVVLRIEMLIGHRLLVPSFITTSMEFFNNTFSSLNIPKSERFFIVVFNDEITFFLSLFVLIATWASCHYSSHELNKFTWNFPIWKRMKKNVSFTHRFLNWYQWIFQRSTFVVKFISFVLWKLQFFVIFRVR